MDFNTDLTDQSKCAENHLYPEFSAFMNSFSCFLKGVFIDRLCFKFTQRPVIVVEQAVKTNYNTCKGAWNSGGPSKKQQLGEDLSVGPRGSS